MSPPRVGVGKGTLYRHLGSKAELYVAVLSVGGALFEEAMAADRARLTSTFEGDVLDAELRHLREEHFGHEAPTIEREERAGFFRYERPRVYGRN